MSATIRYGRTLGYVAIVMLASAPGVAASNQLADAPLASGLSSSTMVKPNIGFIFDDSGSMDDQNMPGSDGTNKSNRCWGWYRYNTIFYNPNYTYKPPFKIDGAKYADGITRFPDAVFSVALADGYFPNGGYTYGGTSNSNTTTDLSILSNLTPNSTSCASGECGDLNSTKYYYSKRTSNLDSTSCGSNTEYILVRDASLIEAPGVLTGSVEAKTNYANWYSYYRRRAMLMKAATAEAFRDLAQDRYRLGLFFMNSVESGSEGTTLHPNKDLKIDDFSGTSAASHRQQFFERLYGARKDGWTPTRGALSRMGRMYAGKITGWDPVQYSCQQNFTIVSTDGFWNTNAEHGAFGPKQIDGSTDVGNQDGGGLPASGAVATIQTDGSFRSDGNRRCYRPSSLKVTNSGTTYDLIKPSTDPDDCTSNADRFGEWIASRINAKTADTGFSGAYNDRNHTVTITAPVSWGDFGATPVAVFDKLSGTGSENFTITAFGNFKAGTSGTPLPYLDSLNVSNTLADIAYYYYQTDLRTEALANCSNTIGGTTYNGLCENNVGGSGKDTAAHQHMTTFSVGLGVNGTIKYEPNYETAPDIPNVLQYFDIKNGTAKWPIPNTSLTRIDDLWHAAVNGRGTYYSARDATTLQDGILSALAGIQARRGASAAAATSNLEPVAGDNFVYVALYQTVKWNGDLQAYAIDPASGQLSGNPIWSAQAKLDQKLAAGAAEGNRAIRYFSASAPDKLKSFTSTNLAADGLAVPFQNVCERVGTLAQCAGLTANQRSAANSAENLVNYLRGDGAYENKATNPEDRKVYRMREHALGDIVNAVPVYMQKPPFSYEKIDTSYGTFKTTHAKRKGTVFVAANDGMLHAIDAEHGVEQWAYVPGHVMPNMWALADSAYADKHRYFVDGSPTIADICTNLASNNAALCNSATDWKTLIVGGLNKGGCGYYALDVTDPANPKGLWEFSDPNMGYSYGNPIIAKRADGKWVVIVSSGYDNRPGGCSNSGDGNGRVFVLDAATGAKLAEISTLTGTGLPVGTALAPSGLAKLNAWIEDPKNPTVDRLYGGDMLGNVWRIDIDGRYSKTAEGNPLPKATRLARLVDAQSNAQPITTKPELAVSGSTPIVLVGTGRYLGVGDLTDTSQQSLYAFKDTLNATAEIDNVRGSSMVARTLNETVGQRGALQGRIIRTLTGTPMSWETKSGWYFDFNPGNRSPGERVNVDMTLQFNLLTVAANVPAVSACAVGGYAFLYFIDINTGLHARTAEESMAGVRLTGNALVAGIKTVKLTSGRTVTIVTDTAGNVLSEDNPNMAGGAGTGVRRAAWREIVD